MANQKMHHVVPNTNGGWDVNEGGGKPAINHCNTKLQAIEKAREISQNQRSELYLHGLDGRVQQKDIHGNDPFPPKG